MAVLVNFKICDNDKACSGMAVCPNGVFSWNEEKQTLEIDNSKCVCCGLCEKACMVSAIRVARTDEEYKKIEEEINNDPRSINDLLVERYGAKLVDPAMTFGKKENIHVKISEGKRPLIIELNKEETIMCLLKSIKVKKIADAFDAGTRYRKLEVEDEEILKEFQVKELPAMLFFKDGNLVGKIEGYYSEDEEEDLLSKVKEIANK